VVRRVLAWLLDPLARLIARCVSVEDPWERTTMRVPIALFGTGGRRDFGWYFEGDSKVRVQTLADIQEWLAGCEYVSDSHLFHEADYWQHPRTFEQLRRGDCEDFALWAWRKMLELKYDADFVCGRTIRQDQEVGSAPGADSSRHAWIVYRSGGKTYLFEPTQGDRVCAVQELELVRHKYMPEFGVNASRRTFCFTGYFVALGRREDRERVGGAAQQGDAADKGL
jgi:hypothetical protein